MPHAFRPDLIFDVSFNTIIIVVVSGLEKKARKQPKPGQEAAKQQAVIADLARLRRRVIQTLDTTENNSLSGANGLGVIGHGTVPADNATYNATFCPVGISGFVKPLQKHTSRVIQTLDTAENNSLSVAKDWE
jgi:nucleoid-associated protein YgaU